MPVGIRTNRRRKAAIDLDLNRVPAGENPAAEHSTARNPIAANPSGENREQERRLTQLGPQEVEVQANQQQEVEVQANQLQLVAQPEPTLIDVEAIDDDDVVLSSPRAFAEAKNNSRRNRGRTVVDVDLEEQIRLSNNNRNKRRRESPKRSIFNCDLYINLDASSSSTMESVKKPPEPPKEPVFTCPICMGPMVEEMSTRCGHIFCKSCIKAAISAQAKCPTCRKKITVKELIRVFLPTTA